MKYINLTKKTIFDAKFKTAYKIAKGPAPHFKS